MGCNRKEQPQRSLVVLPLLAETVRQPGESSNPHPDRQIGTLNVRGANPFLVRLAHLNRAAYPFYLCWGITALFGLGWCAVYLR